MNYIVLILIVWRAIYMFRKYRPALSITNDGDLVLFYWERNRPYKTRHRKFIHIVNFVA
jgi:hypothetical protein